MFIRVFSEAVGSIVCKTATLGQGEHDRRVAIGNGGLRQERWKEKSDLRWVRKRSRF